MVFKIDIGVRRASRKARARHRISDDNDSHCCRSWNDDDNKSVPEGWEGGGCDWGTLRLVFMSVFVGGVSRLNGAGFLFPIMAVAKGENRGGVHF